MPYTVLKYHWQFVRINLYFISLLPQEFAVLLRDAWIEPGTGALMLYATSLANTSLRHIITYDQRWKQCHHCKYLKQIIFDLKLWLKRNPVIKLDKKSTDIEASWAQTTEQRIFFFFESNPGKKPVLLFWKLCKIRILYPIYSVLFFCRVISNK